MFATFLAGIGGKILVGLLAAGLLVGGYAYWQHVVTSRAIIAAQRDALAELNRRQAKTIADRNRIFQQMLALPEGRTRLCAIRGPGDPCCQPRGECKP